jgi:type II secretory ATPase GspE/PulE/Tfp pilus assembly ATPase PilB-like protein
VRKLHGDRGKYFLKETELDNIAHYCDPERILKILRDLKIAKPHQKLTEIPFYRPLPSKEAPDGYKGRIGIFEVLPITQTIKELITKEETADKIEEQAIKEGMLTMVEDGFIKAAQGITSIEEILRVIIE